MNGDWLFLIVIAAILMGSEAFDHWIKHLERMAPAACVCVKDGGQ